MRGGLQRLTGALAEAARAAGAEIACGLDVTEVMRMSGKVTGVRLAGGKDIEARAVLSTLDVKRTFLSLFAWKDLPQDVSGRVASFRMAGSTARLLFALAEPPAAPPGCDSTIFRGPIHISPSVEASAAAYADWRVRLMPDQPPVTLRFPARTDPSLCPAGAAVMTATVGCVPAQLFDGSWTREKRGVLRQRVMAAIETVLPGISAHVLGVELIVPPDIEEALGLADGDLWGGEIAADQMLDMRPWRDGAGPRTPIDGVYLAGPSSASGPLGTCVSGVIAANALLADLGRTR